MTFLQNLYFGFAQDIISRSKNNNIKDGINDFRSMGDDGNSDVEEKSNGSY